MLKDKVHGGSLETGQINRTAPLERLLQQSITGTSSRQQSLRVGGNMLPTEVAFCPSFSPRTESDLSNLIDKLKHWPCSGSRRSLDWPMRPSANRSMRQALPQSVSQLIN